MKESPISAGNVVAVAWEVDATADVEAAGASNPILGIASMSRMSNDGNRRTISLHLAVRRDLP